MAGKKRLGELLVEQGIVSKETVNDALRVQVGGNRRLGHILVQMGTVTDDQLADTLSEQLGIPLTDLDESFSSEVRKVLPRYLCTKYGVMPLALKNHKIMLTAMADPCDQEAITDVEHYTGKVVEPCLARQSDIARSIKRKIPYSLKDFLNPQRCTRISGAIAVSALVLVIFFGVMSYQYIQTAMNGTVLHLSDSTTYKHHNLTVDFDKSGKISFSGRSAFAPGYYSVAFKNTDRLRSFIKKRKDDFSVKQNSWLDWVLENEKSFDSSTAGIAGLGN
jgi:hypothetical protein